MSHLTICEDSRSATSSPELASGHIPSASPDGLTINQSGLVPARASLSARQAKEMGLLTSGTYGPTSSISSASADLSMSLANRLQAVTQTHGSTLYKQTWKEWDTPSGLCRLRQRASVRRTSESGPTGWPTPVVGDMTGGPRPPDKKRGPAPGLQSATALAGWVTPTVEPGTFPLVDGAAARLGRVEPGVARVASSNRVGRLKGYGNAINAQAAAEFIRACMGGI